MPAITIHAVRFVWKAFSLAKVDGLSNGVLRSSYPGMDGTPVPVKVISPEKKIKKIAVFYPGASPFAEDHEEATGLAHIMAGSGYKVYMPRIPLLKQLIISPDNVEWMVHFYQWVMNEETDFIHKITVVGMSFGGALLLKACIDKRMQTRRPANILVYGTFFDFNTAMNYLITGKFKKNNKEIYLKPNEWGGIVLMHNYLRYVNPGFNTENIRQNLAYRVSNDMEKVDSHMQSLSDFERSFINSLMTADYNAEVTRTFQLIRRHCKEELENLSPKKWCGELKQQVFIMHGANDSMVPYTESVLLSEALPRNTLLISNLFGHKTIEQRGSICFSIKEAYSMIRFLSRFLEYNEYSDI